MNGSGMERIGFLAGIITGCCVAVLLFKMMKKDRSAKCKYDERQQIVRGRGFQYGFFGWMAFNGFCIVADIGLEVHFMDLSMTLFCGMVIGTAIYVSYSVWHDGYFSLNENPKRVLSILITATALNVACAVYRIHNGLLEHGVLTFLNGANLMIAIVMVFLLAVMFVKWAAERRNQDKG